MRKPLSLLIASLLCAPLQAGQYVLELTGIPGESTVAGFKNQIDVTSLSFSLQTTHTNTGSGRSMVRNFADLAVTKALDVSSSALLQRCATGTNISQAVLTALEPFNATNRVYFQIIMTNVVVTSISSSGSSERPHESVTLAYESVLWRYVPQGAASVLGGWDLKYNTPLP